jgi:hypothetical protein
MRSKPLLPHPIKKQEANRLLGWGCPIQPRWRLVRKISLGGLNKGRPYPNRQAPALW